MRSVTGGDGWHLYLRPPPGVGITKKSLASGGGAAGGHLLRGRPAIVALERIAVPMGRTLGTHREQAIASLPRSIPPVHFQQLDDRAQEQRTGCG